MDFKKAAQIALMIVVAFVIIVFVALMTVLSRVGSARAGFTGGAEGRPSRRKPRARAESGHAVVDAMNLVHWAGLRPSDEALAEVIVAVTPLLRTRFPGNIVFVTKDRDSARAEPAGRPLSAPLAAALERSRVTLVRVSRYVDPPVGPSPEGHHTERARDDLHTAVVANRLRCAVISDDRMGDFPQMPARVPPYIATEYTYWRAPRVEPVKPAGLRGAVRRPRIIPIDEVLNRAAVSKAIAINARTPKLKSLNPVHTAMATDVIEFMASGRPDLLDDVVALDALIFGEETPAPAWLAKRNLRIYAELTASGEIAAYIAVYDDGENQHLWKAGTHPNELRKGRLRRLVNFARVRAGGRGLTVGTDPKRFEAMAAFLKAEVAAGQAAPYARPNPKPGYVYYRWLPLL